MAVVWGAVLLGGVCTFSTDLKRASGRDEETFAYLVAFPFLLS